MSEQKLADVIRQAREAIPGLTKYKLSKVSGVNESLIGKIERGVVIPKEVTLERLAPHLNADVAELLRIARLERIRIEDQALIKEKALEVYAGDLSIHESLEKLISVYEEGIKQASGMDISQAIHEVLGLDVVVAEKISDRFPEIMRDVSKVEGVSIEAYVIFQHSVLNGILTVRSHNIMMVSGAGKDESLKSRLQDCRFIYEICNEVLDSLEAADLMKSSDSAELERLRLSLIETNIEINETLEMVALSETLLDGMSEAEKESHNAIAVRAANKLKEHLTNRLEAQIATRESISNAIIEIEDRLERDQYLYTILTKKESAESNGDAAP